MLNKKHALGIALIEGLVSILILSLGILALSKLNAHLMNSTGLTKSKAEAIQIAQGKTEELRAKILQKSFEDMAGGEDEVAGKNAAFDVNWNIATPDDDIALRTLTVSVSWTPPASSPEGKATTESVSINTLLNWTDPQLLSNFAYGIKPYDNRLKPPIGAAKRPSIPINRGASTPGVYTQGNNKELRDAQGNVLLILEPNVQGKVREFATISDRVYFDSTAKKLPSPREVFVTITAEGHCFRKHNGKIEELPKTIDNLQKEGDTPYYEYTCYVGEGWHANIGVQSVGEDIDVCVGDPAFPSQPENGWTTLPTPQEISRRTYRGYKRSEGSNTGYMITGIADGGKYPDDGMPKPSHFKEIENLTPDRFNHHFLVTSLSGNDSCANVMNGTEDFKTIFSGNAGVAFCLSPDDDSAEDKCPKIWPGWPGFGDAGVGDFGDDSDGDDDSGGDDGDGGTDNPDPCSGTVKGIAEKSAEKITAGNMSCTIGKGNEKEHYTCSVSAREGSTVTVTQSDAKGTSRTKTATTDFKCGANYTVDFP